MTRESDILCERRGCAGRIELRRPQALNALTFGMIRSLAAALDEFERDDAVTRVVVSAQGERAFCAGGDIRQIYDLAQAGRHDEAIAFWREEYRLNARIKRFSKPYIALIDGICMGGGVGISLHGSHRVAGDRYSFAMPEVGIGFIPDIGATYALPRLAGAVGTWLALTGSRIGPDDALALGLATHVTHSPDFAEILDALTAGEDVEATLTGFARPPRAASYESQRALIDSCFSLPSIAKIAAALDAAASEGSSFAGEMAATLRTKSPASLAIALEQMRRGPALSFEDALRTEFRVVSRVIHGHDFLEGVRAAVIDRSRPADWSPAWGERIAPEAVQAYFAPLDGSELCFETDQ